MSWLIVVPVAMGLAVVMALIARGLVSARRRTAEPHNIYPMW